MDRDGCTTYSDIVMLDKKQTASIKIYPTLIRDSRLNISSDKPLEEMVIFSTDGRKVYQSELNNLSGTINISLPHLQEGVHIIHLKWKDGFVTEKVLIQQR
jgi:hypothetical protein